MIRLRNEGGGGKKYERTLMQISGTSMTFRILFQPRRALAQEAQWTGLGTWWLERKGPEGGSG